MLRFTVLIFCTLSVFGQPPKQISRKLSPRIINGEQAARGQFPWQVAIYVTGIDSSIWFCGGSVIDEEWILTAGHCVDGAASGLVVTGDINLSGNVTRTRASSAILHENYNPKSLENDIGLLKLDKPLEFNENTQAAVLSDENFEFEDEQEITVSGWGRTSDTSTVSETLNFVNLVTIAKSQCEESYGEGQIFDGMICATSGADIVRSTCSGDSGGPVVINFQSDPLHVAIVSFVGDDGCESGTPSGYTRTAYYRNWIRQHTNV